MPEISQTELKAAVDKSCNRPHGTNCGWPECGCDPQIFINDVLPKETVMRDWKWYRRRTITEMRPWKEDYDMTRVSVSTADREAGSPKEGDMIARNSSINGDEWLVSAEYFVTNYTSA